VSVQAEIEGAEPSRAGKEPRRKRHGPASPTGRGAWRRQRSRRERSDTVGVYFFSCDGIEIKRSVGRYNINNMLIHGVYLSPILLEHLMFVKQIQNLCLSKIYSLTKSLFRKSFE
jgi:hypothetical protein